MTTTASPPIATPPTQPGGTESGGTEPGGTKPGGTEPGGTEPSGTEPTTGASSAGTAGRRGRAPWRGRPDDPVWVRPALLALLAATALLYLWDLGASGDANSFYAAAVQAGSESWKAWFFGSIDSSNFITVDKPPGSLWVMGLSARIFGYSSWSLLVPQALMGVATVGLLYASVRRVATARAGLLAGAILALTPAAALMFRFDNPDALLLLLVVAASYAVTRALEHGSTRWLVGAGVLLGFAFLTKTAQALLVVPPLGLAYLVLAPTPVRRRLLQLVAGGVAMVVSAGWWFAAVSLWPASDRPYIGGSTDNNPLELAFGYNGLSRLFGGSGNGGGGGGGGGGFGGNSSFGGATGLGRLLRGEFALEISWLLPAALIGIVALAWLALRSPYRDRLRWALVIWGGTLLVTGLTFSFMQGTIHPYYSVALAPSIAALVAVSGDGLWIRRERVTTGLLVAMVVATAVWGTVLLRREDASGVVQVLVVLAGVLAVVGLLARSAGRLPGRLPGRRWVAGLALAAVVAVGLPTATWGVQTAGSAHTGSIPTAVAGSTTGGFGGGGGFGDGDSTTSSALVTALQATTTRWAAATVGSQSAAPLELASGSAVMAIGGFSGSDAAPTLAQFEAYVAAGDITYYIAGSGGGGGGGGGFGGGGGGRGGSSGVSSQITSWVEATFTSSTTIGGTTVYDLTSATTG